MVTVTERSVTDVRLSRGSWLYVTGTGMARSNPRLSSLQQPEEGGQWEGGRKKLCELPVQP